MAASYPSAAGLLPGLERFLVATRPRPDTAEDDIAFMTLWTDVESAQSALGGRLDATITLDRRDHGEILDSVDYYEMEAGEARRTGGDARYLRLTKGTVGRGLDADIQRELRSRLADLGPEVVEAYVGRRVKRSLVEIAFVSTWTEAAAGRPLDAPIWPDISAHYDTFWIGVYDVILEGRRES